MYHTISRFQIWALGAAATGCVELTAEEGHQGEFDACANLPTCSLSAPVLEIGLRDLTDNFRMTQLRSVFEYWVALDRENCELVRAGLPLFRRPSSYQTNKLPSTTVQIGASTADDDLLNRGILCLAEALDSVGGQLAHPNRGNLRAGLEAALLLDRLQKEFKTVLACHPWWKGSDRVSGLLMHYVILRLHNAHGGEYVYSGLHAVEAALANIPLVQKYLDP